MPWLILDDETTVDDDKNIMYDEKHKSKKVAKLCLHPQSFFATVAV